MTRYFDEIQLNFSIIVPKLTKFQNLTNVTKFSVISNFFQGAEVYFSEIIFCSVKSSELEFWVKKPLTQNQLTQDFDDSSGISV